MIDWPHEDHLNDGAKTALERFRETAAACELEDDAHTWTFLSFARSPEPPMRMLLRSDDMQEVTFTLESTGTWLLRRK